MQTTVTERGQVSIPAGIRKQFNLEPGTGLEWLVLAEGIFLYPVPKDPIRAFCGSSKGSTKSLLEERAKDKEREDKKWKATSSTRRP